MATSKAYLATPESPIVFTASGGNVAFTLDSVAAGAGRQSAQRDLGLAARAFMFEFRAWVKMETTPNVGERIDFYYKTGYTASTRLDNDDGTGDIALSAEDKLRNLRYIGSIIIDEAADVEFVFSKEIAIYSRFIHIVAFNDTADQLSTVANECGCALTPHSIQGQAT